MTISEMWETWRTDGIFLQFNAPPWEGENATALNNMYYLRVLNKPVSAICDSTVAVYPNDFKTVLTDIITSYYYDKWRRLWDNYHFNYNLMSNYSITETGNNSNSGSTSNNNTITKKGTETNNNTKNLTNANTGTETTAQTNTINKNESAFHIPLSHNIIAKSPKIALIPYSKMTACFWLYPFANKR